MKTYLVHEDNFLSQYNVTNNKTSRAVVLTENRELQKRIRDSEYITAPSLLDYAYWSFGNLKRVQSILPYQVSSTASVQEHLNSVSRLKSIAKTTNQMVLGNFSDLRVWNLILVLLALPQQFLIAATVHQSIIIVELFGKTPRAICLCARFLQMTCPNPTSRHVAPWRVD